VGGRGAGTLGAVAAGVLGAEGGVAAFLAQHLFVPFEHPRT